MIVNRCPLPSDYIRQPPAMPNLMDDQAEQYSAMDVRPSVGEQINERLKRNDSILESAAYWMKRAHEAEEWKTLWLCEVMRGDHELEETYTAAEMDRARERLAGWTKHADSRGGIVLEYQS